MDIENVIESHSIFLKKFRFDEAQFRRLVGAFKDKALTLKHSQIQGHKIEPPSEDAFTTYEHLDKNRKEYGLGDQALQNGEIACLILNGGSATRFGGDVKGLVKVFDSETFLGVKLKWIRAVENSIKTRIPTLIMNSFNSCDPTRSFINEHGVGFPSEVIPFNQSVMIRLDEKGEVINEENYLFYPPGHGDFIQSMVAYGLFERLKEEGVRYLWMSNVDNVMASIDPLILGYHIRNGLEMTVEVAPTVEGDKGGAPVMVDSQLKLLESFRFPSGFDFSRLKFLNTNTFIFSIEALLRDPELSQKLGWYAVKKDIHGTSVIQFEQLAGELSHYLKTGYVVVPRQGKMTRFVPIKTRDDLQQYSKDFKAQIRKRILSIPLS